MKKLIIIAVLFFSTQVFTSCVKQDDVSEQIKMEQQILSEDWGNDDPLDDED